MSMLSWQEFAATRVDWVAGGKCPVGECKGDHAICEPTITGCKKIQCKNPHHTGRR